MGQILGAMGGGGAPQQPGGGMGGSPIDPSLMQAGPESLMSLLTALMQRSGSGQGPQGAQASNPAQLGAGSQPNLLAMILQALSPQQQPGAGAGGMRFPGGGGNGIMRQQSPGGGGAPQQQQQGGPAQLANQVLGQMRL